MFKRSLRARGKVGCFLTLGNVFGRHGSLYTFAAFLNDKGGLCTNGKDINLRSPSAIACDHDVPSLPASADKRN